MPSSPAILIKCSCGEAPRFECWREGEDYMMNAYACPPAARGCGKSGPEIDSRFPYSNEAQARDGWNRMREGERAP